MGQKDYAAFINQFAIESEAFLKENGVIK
jgi:hypothetical protein